MNRICAVLIAGLLTVPMTLTLPANAGSDQAGRGRVVMLPATSQWYEGVAGHRQGSALSRQGTFGNGNRAVYLLELSPGADYTLGLRYPADSPMKPSVLLYDQWPGDPGAKRYKFPMGPVLRTNYEKVEYRWRLAVSPRSEGSLAFLVVDAKQGFSGKEGPFRYFLYLTTPSLSPMRQAAEGITYLRGPSDLKLFGQADSVQYVVEYPYRKREENRRREHEGELIRNGDFRRGLRFWEEMSSEHGSKANGQVSLGKDGLRLGNIAEGEFAGVRQSIKRYVREAQSLMFTSDLMLSGPASRDLKKNDESPSLQISICYVDEKEQEHCGENAYRFTFTTDSGRYKNRETDTNCRRQVVQVRK